MTAAPKLRLGLIGDNIARSQAPRLHRLAGVQCGIEVTYDRLIPSELGLDFDAVFTHCTKAGYRGINVTLPYKERVIARVDTPDPLVAAMGAVNTVLFGDGRPEGYNTDFTGFIAGYQRVRGDAAPGITCLIGSGGVGRAIAFALLRLGAGEIRLVDRDAQKSAALASDLRAMSGRTQITEYADATLAAKGATGLINCTPLGMVGYGGTPLVAEAMAGAEWAFDAVYTPVDTTFLSDAAAHGLTLISGYELFFYQGVHAWDHFAGLPLDEEALRDALQTGETPS